ncbi:MAG: hypothetical protein ACRCTD_11035 [Beijerinckiaceae bacterium]
MEGKETEHRYKFLDIDLGLCHSPQVIFQEASLQAFSTPAADRWQRSTIAERWHQAADAFERQIRITADVLRSYNESQPRVPAENPDGGQWTSGFSGDANPIHLAGGFEPHHMQMTVQSFKSKYCLGYIQSKIPREFLGITIEQLLIEERRGTPGAHRCYKLLNEDRFRT